MLIPSICPKREKKNHSK